MGIVRSTDKKTGIVYLYSSEYRYDPVKKRSNPKRTLVGKLDPKTGEMIPTDGRRRRHMEKDSVPKSETKKELCPESIEVLLDLLQKKEEIIKDQARQLEQLTKLKKELQSLSQLLTELISSL
jgi:hypothetical protein